MSTSDAIAAEARFIDKDKNQMLPSFDKLFWPASGGVVMTSPGGTLYWKRRIEGNA